MTAHRAVQAGILHCTMRRSSTAFRRPAARRVIRLARSRRAVTSFRMRDSCNAFRPDKQSRLTSLHTHGHTRGPRQRSSSHHRDDAARAVGDHRRLADARLAARERRAQRHRPLRRAHALQGHRRREAPRTSRRRSTRSAASSTRSPPRNTPATTSRCSTSTCRSRSICCPTSCCNPAFAAEEIEREKKVILEEIKMVEDTPDDLVHELFTQHFWEGHPLGRPILGSKETVESFTPQIAARVLPRRLRRAEPDRLGGRQPRARAGARAGRARRSASCRRRGAPLDDGDAARRAAGHRPRRRSSSRATSASAPTAIRRTTTIATSATS